jgi:hypothetical protein
VFPLIITQKLDAAEGSRGMLPAPSSRWSARAVESGELRLHYLEL